MFAQPVSRVFFAQGSYFPKARTCVQVSVYNPRPRVLNCSIRRMLHSEKVSTPAATAVLDQQIDYPHKETESVTKIERLMALSDKLSRSTGSGVKPAPSRLRGVGSGSYLTSKSNSLPSSKNTEDTAKLPALPKERRMADSYVEMDLRFSKDEGLRENYVGGLSRVRMGRLMEDFDSLAGLAAYQYVLPDGCTPTDASKFGMYLVTAAVDRMDMLCPLHDKNGEVPDLRLSGHVSYATESSLEVFVRLSTIPETSNTPSTTILLGRFAMACRKYGGGKQPIAKLLVEGPEEEELWRMGKEMREGKKMQSLKSLEKTPPNEKEAKMMHDLFVGRANIFDRNAPTPKDVIWMSDTRINSAQLMHPQERNVHNKVFGGYLMRLAYETAYSTACLFSRSPVTFLALDELRFALPVEIGSLLLLDSRVTFSPVQGHHKSFHVSVEAATTDLYTGEKRITNTFHFTFTSEKDLERHVLPRSYKQAMAWLDAQRRREIGITIRRTYDS